ncbi:hypothetical protein BBG47_25250 [Paenibacillus sp. KS1]|nr:hypothetical protein BBG47_25250 [Paenibacillus sp. KS1]
MQINLSLSKEKFIINIKKKGIENPPFFTIFKQMKIIKNGQTDPVYSVMTNRAFEQYLITGSK